MSKECRRPEEAGIFQVYIPSTVTRPNLNCGVKQKSLSRPTGFEGQLFRVRSNFEGQLEAAYNLTCLREFVDIETVKHYKYSKG